MPAYTITRVSNEPPREWNNPKGGIIYYKKVMLEGHDKAVSVGKKSPDALHVGDTIYGTIEKTAMSEDKWHAEQNPNFGGGGQGSGSTGRSNYQPKDEHAIAKAVALKAAVDLFTPVMTEKNIQTMDANVTGLADKFLAWLEEKNPPVPTATHDAEQTGYEKAKATADAIRQKQGQPATAGREDLPPEFYDVPPEGEGW